MPDEGDHDEDTDHSWPRLKALAEDGRTDKILAAIQALASDEQRIALYRSTIRRLAFEPWANPNLDILTALANAAISECERLGGGYHEQANAICFNASANLADCWADAFPRQRRHFEQGIEFATRALQYRVKLNKGPAGMAMAVWALGKHQQSLGRGSEALASFRACLQFETRAAIAAGKPAELVTGAPDGYLIAVGYVALMEGDLPKLAELRELLLAAVAAGPEAARDARVILGQLEETARQLRVEF